MTRSGHVIDTAVFDVSFDWPEDDVQRSAGLVDLVTERLLVVAEEVFDELSPPDAVAAIESLEIDLGVVGRDDADEELPRRFRARLREALQERIKPHGVAPHGIEPHGIEPHRIEPGATARVVPARQAELEELQHFLQTGRLPWSVAGGGASEFDAVAARVAKRDGPRLVAFLRAAADDAVLERALQQLPEAALRELLARIDPDRSDRLVRLYEEVRSALDRAPLDWRARDDLELGFWRALLIPLLRQGSTVGLEALTAAALEALELSTDAADGATRERLAQAIDLALGPAVLEPAVETAARMVSEPVVETAARVVSEPVVETAARMSSEPVVETAARMSSEPVVETAARMASEPAVEIAARMASEPAVEIAARMAPEPVVGTARMASEPAVETVSPAVVAAESTEAAVEAAEPTEAAVEAAEPTEAARVPPGQDPEAEARPDRTAKRAPRRSVGEEREEAYEARLTEALLSGAGSRLRDLWPTLLGEHTELAKRVVATHVRRPSVRRAVAEGFPATMFIDVVRLLDPAAAEYVAEVLERARVFSAGRGWAGVKARLREHTLAHLVEQRGGFEAGTYLLDLIRRVAEDEGASAEETRAAVAEKLRRSSPTDPFRAEMFARISEIGASAGPAVEASWAAYQTRLDEALSSREASGLVDLWETLARERPDLIERAALRLAGREEARRLVGVVFPTSLFVDLVRALDPVAGVYLAELMRHADAFAIGGVASEPEARGRLREHTLTYLARHGTGFEPLSFLTSLIGRIAEVEGTGPEMVRASVAAALRASPVPDAFQDELRARIEALGSPRLEGRAPDASVAADRGTELPPSVQHPVSASRAEERAGRRSRARRSQDESEEEREVEYEARLAEALLSGAGSRLRDVWPAMLVEHSELVRRVLVRYAQRADVRRAVAERFPAAMFLDLVRVLDPAASAYVGELLERGRTFAGGGKVWAGVRARLREQTLAHLVEEAGTPFERRSYLASLIDRLQGGVDGGADETRTTLAALRRSAELSALVSEVEPAARGARDPDAHVDRLHTALTSGDATGLTDVWPALLRDRAELVERTVLRHVAREDARVAIALRFPLDMFLDVVRVLAPAAGPYVAELLDRAQAFVSGASPAQAELRLREHTLAVLVETHGASFEPRRYVEALVARAAADAGMSAAQVAAATAAVLRAAPDPVRPELLALFEEQARAVPEALITEARAPAGVPGSVEAPPPDAPAVRALRRPLERTEDAEASVARAAADRGTGAEQIAADAGTSAEQVAADAGTSGEQLAADAGTGAAQVATAAAAAAELRAAPAPDPVPPELLAPIGGQARVVPEPRTKEARAPAEAPDPVEAPSPEGAAVDATRHPLEHIEEEAGRTRRPGLARRQADALLRAYDLMEAVRAVVFGRAVRIAPHVGVGPAIEELARAHPRRLVALVRELLAAEVGAAVLAVRLSAAELRRMVGAWLEVAAARGPGRRVDVPDRFSDLRAAVASFAVRAVHPRRYFAAVLDRLAAGSLLDFEEILAEATSEAPAPEAAPAREPTPAGGPTLDDFDRYLAEGVVTVRSTPARLLDLVESLLPEQADRLASWLAPRLELRAARARLVGLLPDHALARILDARWPGDWARAQAYVDLVEDVSFLEDGPLVPRPLTWRFTLDYLAGRSLAFEDAAFARNLVDELSSTLGWTERGDLEARMRARLGEEAPSSYAASLEDEAAVAPLPTELVAEILLAPIEPEQETRIENAGLVLATPYLPRLFSMMELMDGNAFKDRQAAARAAQLTQFVVTGREDTPEFLLSLNRILCGIPANQPLPRRFDPSERERAAVDGLLRAMIQHWGALGNTSVAGLRETFLQRGGTLRLDEDVWSLRVEEKAFDVLIDRVPWTFKTIRFPWMRNVIQVEWR